MRILHCLAQLPANTGSGVYYFTLVNGMEKKGHKNALIYGIQSPFSSGFSKEIQQYPVIFNTEELPFPIAGMSDEMPYESSVYSKMSPEMYNMWIKSFKEKLEEAKAFFNPDVIITHHIFILSSLVREVFDDKPVIGISHGTDIRQVKKNPWIKDRYIKNVDKLTHYLSLSRNDKESLSEVFEIPKEKITITGGGFKKEFFYEEKERKYKICRIIYAGKISNAKGVYELASALKILNEKYENIALIMVGNAEEEQKEKLYENSGEAENLIIVAAKNQKDLASLMRHCNIFVLPSYYEGLGLIAIEGLASGLRAVTTKIEGLMDLLGEEVNSSGVIEYVDLPRLYEVDKPYEEDKPKFVEDLADKLAVQIERVKSGEEVPESIKERIKSHSWSGIIDKIESLLFECIN